MKLQINISEDEELRAFLRDQIRGAVVSITREELLKSIRDEIMSKCDTGMKSSIRCAIDSAAKSFVKEVVSDTAWRTGKLTEIIREETRAALTARFASGKI